MQLQESLQSIQEAGLQVVAISYDRPEVLKRFAEDAGITFPLLSDPDSRAIDAYHIRNQEAGSRAKLDGIPHPGTFIIDEKGILRARLGYEGYRKRHDAEELIKAAKALKRSRIP